MRNSVLCWALLCSTALPLCAQQWFSDNAYWANYFSAGFQGPGFEYVTVEADTLLQGLPAVNLKRVHDLVFGNDFVDFRQARQQGDTIRVWNDYNSQFYVHYNFSLAAGDSVAAPMYWGGGQFRYYIDSVGTLLIAGHLLRFQQVHFSTNLSFYHCQALIIETIGFVNGECLNTNTNNQSERRTHFFPDEPNMGAVDGWDWRFCLYRNDQLEYTDPGSYCAALTGATVPEYALPAFRIQPNPFAETFSIVASDGQLPAGLRMFDAAGRLVLQAALSAASVDTGALGPGFYFLEITSATGKRALCRAVKL